MNFIYLNQTIRLQKKTAYLWRVSQRLKKEYVN